MSSWHSYQLKYVFGLGGMFTFYGIVGLIVYSCRRTCSASRKSS